MFGAQFLIQIHYTVIDGFPLGSAFPCVDPCDNYIGLATSAFDQRDPGHAAIQESKVYYDIDVCRTGPTTPVTCVRNSLFLVVVFKLDDGSTHAAGVARVGVGDWTPTAAYPYQLP